MIIVFILEKYWKVSTIEIFPVNHETKLRNVSKFIGIPDQFWLKPAARIGLVNSLSEHEIFP